MKRFILQYCQEDYTRDNYREFMNLAALQHLRSVSIYMYMYYCENLARAMHPACRMMKAIYSMKIELLFRGNDTALDKNLTAHELQVVKRLNRFVVCMYLPSMAAHT